MPKILVVDDEPGMRQVMSKILVPLGYELVGTDEGARAVQLTKEQNPDLVLLDIRLADMDSQDVITALKGIKPNLPIIVLSGFGDVDVAVELVKLGAFDYISKPFKVNDFTAIINKALGKTAQKAAAPALPVYASALRRTASMPETPETAAEISGFKRSKSNIPRVIAIGAVIAAAVAAFFAWDHFLNVPKDKEFKLTYSNPSGICFGNNGIWVSDWAGESIYKHRLDKDLKIDMTFKTQDVAPTGIAFDGKNIWTSSALEQKINMHRLDPSLSIETSFKSPGPSPAGLFYDGKNLWSVDFQQGRVYRHKAGDPSVTEAAFDTPAQNPCGLFIRGGFAYVADGKTNRIYKMSSDTFFLAAVLEIPGFEEQKRRIASIGYDGKSLWACAGGIDRLFRFRMSSLKPVKY